MPLAPLLAGPDRHLPVLHNTEQPCSKGCPTGIETMDPPGRNDKNLLGQFLGQDMLAARERDAEPVHRVEVPLEQLPPRLLAASLRRVYRIRLEIHVH